MYVCLCTERNKLLPVPSYLSCLCPGAAGSTEGRAENSCRQASSLSLHAGGAALTYSSLLSSGKTVTGISMPENWQLYKNRFGYLSLKFLSSRVMQFWYQLLCGSRSLLAVHNCLPFRGSAEWHISVGMGCPETCLQSVSYC